MALGSSGFREILYVVKLIHGEALACPFDLLTNDLSVMILNSVRQLDEFSSPLVKTYYICGIISPNVFCFKFSIGFLRITEFPTLGGVFSVKESPYCSHLQIPLTFIYRHIVQCVSLNDNKVCCERGDNAEENVSVYTVKHASRNTTLLKYISDTNEISNENTSVLT